MGNLPVVRSIMTVFSVDEAAGLPPWTAVMPRMVALAAAPLRIKARLPPPRVAPATHDTNSALIDTIERIAHPQNFQGENPSLPTAYYQLLV